MCFTLNMRRDKIGRVIFKIFNGEVKSSETVMAGNKCFIIWTINIVKNSIIFKLGTHILYFLLLNLITEHNIQEWIKYIKLIDAIW